MIMKNTNFLQFLLILLVAFIFTACGSSGGGGGGSSSPNATGDSNTPDTPTFNLDTSDISGDFSNIVAGSDFPFSLVIRNRGASATPAATVDFYYSDSETFDRNTATELEGSKLVVPMIDPGSTHEIRATLTAPSAAGNYFFAACVTLPAGSTNTDNNCRSITIRVFLNGANLVITSFSASPAYVSTGDAFTLTAEVRNIGNLPSLLQDGFGNIEGITFFRSANPTADFSIIADLGISQIDAISRIANLDIPALDPDETTTITSNALAESSADTYYYGAYTSSFEGEAVTSDNISEIISINLRVTNGWEQVRANDGTNTNVFSRRTEHDPVVFQNKMWVISTKEDFSSTDVWNSINGVTWNEVTDDAFPVRVESRTLVFQDKLWTLGGRFGDARFGALSSPDGVTWRQETTTNFPNIYNHGAVVFQEKMWILGGSSLEGERVPSLASQLHNDLWNSSNGTTWTKLPAATAASPRWAARIAHTAVVFNNKMWVMGGFLGGSSSNNANDIWSSPDGENWTEVTSAAAWSERVHPNLAVFDNKLWIMGGFDEEQTTSSTFIQDIWYSANGANWTLQNENRFSALSAVAFDNNLWTLGSGRTNARFRIPLNDIWSFTLENDTFATALELNYSARGDNAHSAILEAGEQDYYLIDLPADTYNIDVSGDASTNCTLYNNSRTEITKDANGGNCAIERTLPASDYYILVEGADDDATGGYNLRISPQE
jgi:hypothetical protein